MHPVTAPCNIDKIIIVTVWYPGPSATPPVKTSFQKVTLRPGFPRDKFPKQSWNHAAFRRQQLLGSNIEAQILSSNDLQL